LDVILRLVGSVHQRFWQFSFTACGVALAALLPKATGNYERINILLLLPLPFLAGSVDVVVMDSAKGDGELIAHFEAEPTGLRVAHVMRVRGGASANETRLAGDEAQMLFAADPFSLTKLQNAFVDLWARTAETTWISCYLPLVCLSDISIFRFNK
jgi:hypothetical protein